MAVLAKSVVVVGGPTGSAVGAPGPTGATAGAVPGPAGLAGALGRLGPTGMQGIAGLVAAFAGASGPVGPLGSDGYPGPGGPAGFSGFVPRDQFEYFENTSGFQGIGFYGAYAGCKFYYTPKKPHCFILAICTFLAEPMSWLALNAGMQTGFGPAPNAGDEGWGGSVQLAVTSANMKIPCTDMFFDQRYAGDEGAVIEPRWFDVAAFPPGGDIWSSDFYKKDGAIRNISFMIMEL